jgi:hypothetical protein
VRHLIGFALGRVLMYHRHSQPLPQVRVYTVQILAERFQVAVAFLPVRFVRFDSFVRIQIIVDFPPDYGIHSVYPCFLAQCERFACLIFEFLLEILKRIFRRRYHKVAAVVLLPVSPVLEVVAYKLEVVIVKVHVPRFLHRHFQP